MSAAADVYISYAGNNAGETYENSRDEIVEKIKQQLQQKNIAVKEYKTALDYKDDLKEYMLDIAYAKIIIILISDKYLKSDYCMYEAVEILSRNKRELSEKIFPIIINDADIFDTDKRIDYVDYWIERNQKLDDRLKGKDPKLFLDSYDTSKLYREIAENMDEFLGRLADMCQLPATTLSEQHYKIIIDKILKQLESKTIQNAPLQVMAVQQNSEQNILYPQLLNTNNTQDVNALVKMANGFMSMVTNKVDDTILDSEKAKKEYININFDEISDEGPILPGTLNFIYGLRTDKTKYEPYRQSLIISALSLGLIKKYDETKARLLVDFATDDDPVLSYRALAGVVIGLLDKEDYISDNIKRKLETMQGNVNIQRCLLNIYFFLGNIEQLQAVSKSLQNIDYSKFEFFDRTQHWFQPFYENNPILKEHVADKKFAKGLLESVVFLGLDSTKYALALSYSSLTKENLDEFKRYCELDRSVTNTFNNDNLRKKFLLEIEVSKYVLEFYIYATLNNDAGILDLIEDKAELRSGYLGKLVFNEMYQQLLQANILFLKKEYNEAATVLKQPLEDQPNNIELLLLYGTSNYYAGNNDEVITSLEKVVAKGIKEIQVLAFLGDAYFNTKNYEKAIDAYEALLEQQTNVAAIITTGRSYGLKRVPDNEKALEYYLKALNLENDNYTALVLTGDIYINKTPQDFSKAFEYYSKAFDINDSNVELVRMLTNCAIRLPGNDIEESEKIYKKNIELEPENALPYMAMGDLYFNKGPKDYFNAFNYYECAFNLTDSNIVLIKLMSECLTNLPDQPLDKCIKLYLKWIELEPANATPYFLLGDAYINKSGNYNEAFNYYFTAAQIQSSETVLETIIANAALVNEPDIEKIEKLYVQYKNIEAAGIKPDVTMAAFYMNKLQPEYDKAEVYYLKAYAVNDNDIGVLTALGKLYQVIPQPDYEKSFIYLNKLIQLEPDGFYPNFYFGWGNFATGNYDGAKLYFEKCLPTAIEQNIVYQNLGHIALIQKDEVLAKELYKMSFDLFNDKTEFYNSSMNDAKYLQQGGVAANEFETVLKAVMQ